MNLLKFNREIIRGFFVLKKKIEHIAGRVSTHYKNIDPRRFFIYIYSIRLTVKYFGDFSKRNGKYE